MDTDNTKIIEDISYLRKRLQFAIEKFTIPKILSSIKIILWLACYSLIIIILISQIDIRNNWEVSSHMLYYILAILWAFFTYLLIPWLCEKVWRFCSIQIDNFLWKVIWNISTISDKIAQWIVDIQSIDEVLEKITECYSLMTKIERLKLLFFYSKTLKNNIISTRSSIVKWMNHILIDLHSDLSTRLLEQQKSLEWAKSEVEKNLRWTNALEQVSEIQKARLDRQIEQFEELQRVLVKI